MSKSDFFEDSVLRVLFEGKAGTSWSATDGATDLWVGLHTADPTDAGSTAAEGGYADYERTVTDRSTGATGWSVSSGPAGAVATVAPVGDVDFPQNASATTTGTFTHFSVNPSSDSIAANTFYTGTVTPNINFSENVTPRITTDSSITED